jgi:hypothetical protein
MANPVNPLPLHQKPVKRCGELRRWQITPRFGCKIYGIDLLPDSASDKDRHQFADKNLKPVCCTTFTAHDPR